jgi:UDP-N-acetylglucosamine:LPS N-acetylglucosamine transferase
VSTGAEIALPWLFHARLRRTPVVYVECGAQVSHLSFTGRFMARLADRYYVQWPELLAAAGRRAEYAGSLICPDPPDAAA